MDVANTPERIRIAPYDKQAYLKTKRLIDRHDLTTVCVEANCPNRYECFSKGTATFMILGDTCTRNCRYCNVRKGVPRSVDDDEPRRVAEAVRTLGLTYAVITCVTRDDLEDGGAGQFAKTVEELRSVTPHCRVELLISDLKGDWRSLNTITESGPDVLNHNIEVVKELFPALRPKGGYDTSLALLKKAKELNPLIRTKSGFMLGFGETESQVEQTIKDLKGVGCDILTIGQYLQPSKNHFKVKKYYAPEEFERIAEKARSIGIKHVVAGPLVRSSYKARESLEALT
ncbi:MAG: lipoyl synthase [Candidatus Woesearchaeota archaeon]